MCRINATERMDTFCHNVGATSHTTQLAGSTSTPLTKEEIWVDGIVCLPISKLN